MKTVIYILLFFLSSSLIANVHLGPNEEFKNIEEAFRASAIQQGDTVFLHAGYYKGYQGISSLKGDSLNWIVFTKYQNDSILICGGWQFMSCEYIKFLNLTFKAEEEYPGRLINVDNSGSCKTQSKYIIFDSCAFSNVMDNNSITSFKFGGVDNFEVLNCTFNDMSVCNAFDFNVCHNGLISGNIIQNCLSGGHIKGGASNITMERNLFINASFPNWVAFELGGDTGDQFYCPEDKFEVKNINFYSNIVIGGYRGIALSSSVDCNVINNTFYNCGQATFRFLTTSHLYPELSGNKVINNIFAFGESAYINGSTQTKSAAVVLNNIYFSILYSDFYGPYWDTPELDEIKEVAPLIFGNGTNIFIDQSKFDFNLVENSPAVGNGIDTDEPKFDFYGNPFSVKNRSIGAIESKNLEFANDIDIYFEILITPNPAIDYIEISFNNHWVNPMVQDIEVFDVLGRKHPTPEMIRDHPSSRNDSGGNLRLDVSQLQPGVYFVRVGSEFLKFIKM